MAKMKVTASLNSPLVNGKGNGKKTKGKKGKKKTQGKGGAPNAAKQEAAKSAAKAAGAKAKEKAKPGEKVKVKGNKVITTKKDGTQVTKSYGANGKVREKETVTGKGKNKTTTTVKYNKNGERTSRTVVTGTGKNKVTVEVTYDPETQKRTQKTITTEEPSTTTINYNKKGDPTDKTIKDSIGTTRITYEYDDKGNLKGKTETFTDIDNEKSTKSITYSNVKTDKKGRVTSRTATVVEKDAEGKEVKYTVEQTFDYKSDGSVTKKYKRTNENGSTKETVKEFDKDGHLTSTSVKAYRKDGTLKYERKTGNYNYDTPNSVRYDQDETWYDKDGKTPTETDSNRLTDYADAGQQAEWVPKSNLAAAKAADKLRAKYPDAKITQNDNKVTIEYKNGKVETRQYDKNGKVTKKTETKGHGKEKETITTEYKNGKKANKTTVKPNGTVITTEYDENGKKATKTTKKPNGTVITTEYDKDGNPTRTTKTLPDGKTESTEYLQSEVGGAFLLPDDDAYLLD